MAVGVLLGLAALLLGALSAGSSPHRTGARAYSRPTPPPPPAQLRAHTLAVVLPSPVKDAAAVVLSDRTLALLGGLDANDTSTADVTVLAGDHVSSPARLPLAQHDAQGALLDGRAYVFGGGQVSSYDHVLSFDPGSGVSQAGVLPRPASDVAVAAVDGCADVIGGYDGRRALDTILAWCPGQPVRLAAHLPFSLRYAAAAAIGGQILIVGGSHGDAAGKEILRFDPVSGRVSQIGRLPGPITHASAVAFGSYVYLLGGRGSSPESQTSAILAIDPRSGAVAHAGHLPLALSDAAAGVVAGRILIAGGQSEGATQSSVLALEPVRAGSAG